MNLLTRILLFILFIIIFNKSNVLCQNSPPPMSMPTENNKKLIDSIIKIANYESYFYDYCIRKVNNVSSNNNWSIFKKNDIINSIKFKYYESSIYNSFSFYSPEQLNSIIITLSLLNNYKDKSENMILTNLMMQNNLELFTESLIEGKYIIYKK